MVNRKNTGNRSPILVLAAALVAGLVALPALSWAGPRVIVVGPRYRPHPARVVVVPQTPRHRTVIKVLPHGHKRVVVKGVPYYYHRGVFYRSGANGYVVVDAPLGFRIGVLPDGYTKIRVGTGAVYYHNGNYFTWDPALKSYVVVAAPQGAVVAYLPQGHTRVNIGGEIYYKYNGVYYRQQEIEGSTMFVVTEI